MERGTTVVGQLVIFVLHSMRDLCGERIALVLIGLLTAIGGHFFTPFTGLLRSSPIVVDIRKRINGLDGAVVRRPQSVTQDSVRFKQ